ncbi:TetR/AcrR family transcriptional regulator [Nocardioides daeguensis]|uniref:Transcriptional regulator n=1 Tax=Nocardioides daeguensis TaxID=908359 RepID=A0ABP6VJN3_9ACTN|nr:TetR/AcrR family transcriptional regulator [Nocardioides daeguensis]MBV6728908.1 TetR/AcrR family transcriptional regulator [Nocardioides daeguensis]MCR1773429.1 TetR/AcrR family transcriptional regulator [Nocardioides daeguensis]
MSMSTGTTLSRKPNRRGVAAREKLLSTAVEMLGTGRPETVSINMVAKEAGLSWGSVQNLFGDSDGFWSAVADQVAEVGPDLWAKPQSTTIAGRVAEVTELYSKVLASPYAVTVETMRWALPRPLDVLEETHPRTAASIRRLDELASKAFVHFFDGVEGLDEERRTAMSEVLPAMLRSLRNEQLLGTHVDLERAHKAIVTMLTDYLEG